MDKVEPASKKTVKKQAKTTALAKVEGISSLEMLPQILTFAEQIKGTTWGNAFKDGDGKINTEDIVANIILGHEMGIEPMAAIMQGRDLNKDSYFSVLKGKSLGLDPITSIENIYPIKTQAGKRLTIGVYIMVKALLDVKGSFKILKDYAPKYRYYHALKNDLIPDDYIFDEKGIMRDGYELLRPDHKPAYITEQVQIGKVFLKRIEYTKQTSIRFIRKSNDLDFVITKTLQDAIDKGLYPGNHSSLIDGSTNKPIVSKGKHNWITDPFGMLRTDTLRTGCKIIAADRIQGMSETSEILDMTDQTYTIDEDGNAIPEPNDNA